MPATPDVGFGGWGEWAALTQAEDEADEKEGEVAKYKKALRECEQRELHLREAVRSEQRAHGVYARPHNPSSNAMLTLSEIPHLTLNPCTRVVLT